MLDVRRLMLLRELAHRGTIAAVADALSYTPSAVSQQLATLEREASVPLLERTGRSVRLTSAAHRLVEHAEAVFEQLEQAAADLRADTGAIAGQLRIGAYPTAMRALVTPALVALSREHPGLRVSVTEIDPATAPGALRAGRLDLALLHEYDGLPAGRDRSLQTEPLFDEAVLLAAPAHSDAPITTAAAADADWVSGTSGTLCHEVTIRTCETAGFAPRIRHHTDDYAAVLALVAAGQGVALVPETAAFAPPVGVRFTPITVRRRTLLAYRRGTARLPATAAGTAALHSAAAGIVRDPVTSR
ncbi:LysR substrate-binding domain-containing protein [Tsukamurella soli]|uniref:LysR family transcriptional regulator n=1 Tax=Tsukamurella soli TaxID=644556 RepID=A0ABP8JPF4_9ACTN